MKKQGMGRIWLLPVALIGVLALALPTLAAGKIKTKTFSSGSIDEVISTDPPGTGTATYAFQIGKKRSKVKDVNVGVRINHSFDGDLDIALAHRGVTVALAENNGGSGANFGSGSPSCNGNLTVFNDEAATSITTGTAPFAGQFRPVSPLSAFDQLKLKREWTLSVVDEVAAPPGEGNLYCVELEIKYKKKKKN